MDVFTTNDRFTRGMIAGFIASIPTIIINLLARYLHLSSLLYLDFASIMIHGHTPTNSLEKYFALFAEIFFMSVLGAVFPYLLKILSTKNYILKGAVFGAGAWFLIYAVTVLYKVPELQIIPAKTAISNFIGAAIYGITLSYVVANWDRKLR